MYTEGFYNVGVRGIGLEVEVGGGTVAFVAVVAAAAVYEHVEVCCHYSVRKGLC